MNKKDIPLNDIFEKNPDREYINGPYSTFDPELSRTAKEFVKKYKNLKKITEDTNDNSLKQIRKTFAENMKLKYKNAVQALVSKNMTDNGNAIIEYFNSFRKNVMDTILSNEILLDYALRFKDLWVNEKETFLMLLDRFLSDKYHIGRSYTYYNPDDTNSAAAFSKRGRGDNTSTSMGFVSKVETLDKFIECFAHEFSHKLVSETPDKTPLGAQAAHIADKFYISSEEDKEGYFGNADEMLSYAAEKAVSDNFETNLRTMVAIKNLKQMLQDK